MVRRKRIPLLPSGPYRAEPIAADGSEYAVLAGKPEVHVATTYNYRRRKGSARALAEFIVVVLEISQP